jgi:DNA-binding transcriptional LysR family regulator
MLSTFDIGFPDMAPGLRNPLIFRLYKLAIAAGQRKMAAIFAIPPQFMKIDDITAFAAVVRNQSVSGAAHALRVTQSAITRRVQNFESALGVELLDRSVKPPRPNALGSMVYEQCSTVLREVERLQHMVRPGQPPEGSFRVGLVQSIGDVVLLASLPRLNERFPGLRTEVASGWGAQLVEQVASGDIDAAFALFPATKVLPEGLRGRTLGSVDLVVVAQKGSLREHAHCLRDIHEHGWVLNPDGCGFRAGLERALGGQGLPFRIRLETFGADLQLGLVASGQGLGLMPRLNLDHSPHRARLEVLELADFKPVLDIWLIQPHSGNPRQQAADFLAAEVQRAFAH